MSATQGVTIRKGIPLNPGRYLFRERQGDWWKAITVNSDGTFDGRWRAEPGNVAGWNDTGECYGPLAEDNADWNEATKDCMGRLLRTLDHADQPASEQRCYSSEHPQGCGCHAGPDEEPPARPIEPAGVDLPDELAQDIRRIDGNHGLGAGELAERLFALGWRRYKITGAGGGTPASLNTANL